MKKILISSVILLLIAFSTFGQSDATNISVTSKSAIGKTNKTNTAITLCGMQNDTLTLAQLNGCSELVILDSQSKEILSYTLSYISSDGADLHEYKGAGNKLAANEIDHIITAGVQIFLIDQIYLAGGPDNKVPGHRWFVIKRE